MTPERSTETPDQLAGQLGDGTTVVGRAVHVIGGEPLAPRRPPSYRDGAGAAVRAVNDMTQPEERVANEEQQSWRVRLLTRLTGRRVPWIAAAVAFLIALPSLAAGYFIDDQFHEYVLRGNSMPGGPRGAWDLYRFADGSRDFVKSGQAGWPWWTNLDLRLAFFRPLASLWRWADFHLFGSSATVPHLETCLAYAVLVFIVARLYGRWVGGGAGGLAALAFAVDDGHSIPVTWIANRYAILAAIFGFASLLAHTRARSSEAPSIPARLASPVLLALALLSGETSLGVLGYLAGYAWFVDGRGDESAARLVGARGRRSALLALAPHVLVTAAWMTAYRVMGYGVSGSAFYVDPLRSPGHFATKFVVRFPQLVLSGVLGPPSEAWTLVPPERAPFVAAFAALLGGAVVFFVVRTASRDASARGAVRALLTGAAISAIPVCSTIPDDRNFLFAGFGFFGILALAIANVWREAREAPRRRRAMVGLLVAVHLVLAPLLFPLRGLNMALAFGGFIQRGAKTVPSGERVQGKTLVMVGVPDSLIILYMTLQRLLEPGPKPSASTILTVQSAGSYTLECIDADTVVIKNPAGELHSPFAAVYSDRPFSVGQVFERDIDRVEVLEVTARGEPSAIRATIRVPASERVWLVWRGNGLVEMPPPRPGEKSTFQAVDLFTAMNER